MKSSIDILVFLALLLMSSCANPHYNSTAGQSEVQRMGGKRFQILLPAGMKLVSMANDEKQNYPEYREWGRRPWSPGALMEVRNANVMVVSYYNLSAYQRIVNSDGSMYASPYYMDTMKEFHAQIRTCGNLGGRAPTIIRYDVRTELGVFCLVASVDKYNNPKHDSDVAEMIEALKSFHALKESHL